MPELCDVTFLVGPEQVAIHGVKAILGTRSRYTLFVINYGSMIIIPLIHIKWAVTVSSSLSTNMHFPYIYTWMFTHAYEYRIFVMLNFTTKRSPMMVSCSIE